MHCLMERLKTMNSMGSIIYRLSMRSLRRVFRRSLFHLCDYRAAVTLESMMGFRGVLPSAFTVVKAQEGD